MLRADGFREGECIAIATKDKNIRPSIRKAIESASVVVVGSGLFGLTIAERIANILKMPVVVLERREHIGGNAWSFRDASTGIDVHQYGTHIFHTSNVKVWEYVNQFTEFTDYRHSVWANHEKRMYPLPINLATLNMFFEKNFSPREARDFIKAQEIHDESLDSFESKMLSVMGSKLYKAFIRGYTLKQWQTNPNQLPSSLAGRVPIRYNFNLNYFEDSFQGIPKMGYDSLMENMIKNSLISTFTDTDFFDVKNLVSRSKLVVYTGPIDEYFDYQFDLLGWRTVDLSFETLPLEDFQGTAVVNYSDVRAAFTRIHEFHHLNPERRFRSDLTIVAKEYSRLAGKNDEPYYPVNTEIDRDRFSKYRSLVSKEHNVIFGGRLATYKYLDMHMAIASALVKFETEILPVLGK